jgi:hypothetical protein
MATPLNPEEMFKQGCFFDIAAMILDHDTAIRAWRGRRQGMQVYLPTLIPTAVNSCFSIELYFKCILVIENPSAMPYGHSLLQLFNNLSANVQKRIEHFYGELLAKDPIFPVVQTHFPNADYSLLAVITESSDCFTKWRYVYEEPSAEGHRAGNVRGAARNAIIEMRPAWGTLWDDLRKLPTLRIR